MAPITRTEDLRRFCESLRGAPYLAVDTEFMRDRTYWPRLCLVQIAGPADDAVAAVDTLAPDLDPTPLYDLLRDPASTKVFHAARQDIEIFHHQGGFIPEPLFDTQIAAMVCGFGDSVSYERLVAKLAKAQVDKASRFTDWAARPLSDRQLAYALSDVTHLRTIYAKLRSKLDRSNRTAWVEEEEAILTDPVTYDLDPREAWRRLKVRTNRPAFLAVLREVAAWRELEAQRRDVPRNRIIRDETVVEIAAHAPTSEKALARTRGLANGMARGKAGAALLAAVDRGLKTPPESCPTMPAKPDLPKGIGPVVDMLKVLLKLRSEQHDVAQRLVATVADLEALAAADDADIRALRGWRREVFGADALALKQGQLAFTVRDRAITVLPVDDLRPARSPA